MAKMKVYLLDNDRKIKKIKKELEKVYSVESKENLKFKMTKNDFVIVSDAEGVMEGLDKLKNLIMLVTRKDKKYIWQLVNEYKTIDIIDNLMSEEYIVERIERKIGKEE